MDELTVYGIPNCDTMKKMFRWLEQNKISYRFHNYKESGIDAKTLGNWCKLIGWEQVFNKRSSTWKEVQVNDPGIVLNESTAIKLMVVHNSIIKRPMITFNKKVLAGFDEKNISALLLTHTSPKQKSK